MTFPFSGSCLSVWDIEKGMVRRKRLGAVRSLGGTCGAMYMPGYKGRGEFGGRAPRPSIHRQIGQSTVRTRFHSVPETALNSSELREQPKNDFIIKRQESRHLMLDFSMRRARRTVRAR